MTSTWKPRIVLFQCQWCLFSEADQKWVDTQRPRNVRLVKVPCTGRISPLYILNALQGGADGVLVSGCKPEMCHFKEGNLGARRQLDEFAHFLEYAGMEEGRVHFAWLDVQERGRIQQELADMEARLVEIGPSERMKTRAPLKEGGLA